MQMQEQELRLRHLEARVDGLAKQVLEVQAGLGQIAEILAQMLHIDAEAEQEDK